MDEQTRAFVEQHDRKQQIPTLPPARNGKVAAQRALGVAAQSAQPPIQHPPAQRMMVPNGQYCMDAQGRPVHVNAWQQLQQRSMPNGPYTSAQLQQLTPQQHQQMLQHQFAQQQYVQQQQLAQQRGSVPNSAPDSARPPPSQPGKSPSLLQVPPPPLQRAVSRTASRSASPIPPHLRPPSASISHPMQPTTSAMPISNSNPTLLPIRASTLPAASPANAMNLNLSANHFAARNSVAGPSQSAPATSTAQRAPDGGPRLDKPYRRDMKLSAVARARKREDMTSRLKRYIEQAQAQLEVVMREQEKAKVAAEKKDSVEEDGQENFNGLILD